MYNAFLNLGTDDAEGRYFKVVETLMGSTLCGETRRAAKRRFELFCVVMAVEKPEAAWVTMVMNRLTVLEEDNHRLQQELGANYFGTFFMRFLSEPGAIREDDVRDAVLEKLLPLSTYFPAETRVFLRMSDEWLGLYVERDRHHQTEAQIVAAVRAALTQFNWEPEEEDSTDDRPARTYADGEYLQLVCSPGVLQKWEKTAWVPVRSEKGGWETRTREASEEYVHQIVSAWNLTHGNTLFAPPWHDEWAQHHFDYEDENGVDPEIFTPFGGWSK